MSENNQVVGIAFILGLIMGSWLLGGCVTKQYALDYGEGRYLNGKFDGAIEGYKKAESECRNKIEEKDKSHTQLIGNYLGLRANVRALINASDNLSKNPNGKGDKKKYDEIFNGLKKDLE